MPTKRFYCTVCKKVKRVRVLPAVVDTPMSPNPANRTGECDRHSRPVFNVGKSDQMREFARATKTPIIEVKSVRVSKHKMKGAK